MLKRKSISSINLVKIILIPIENSHYNRDWAASNDDSAPDVADSFIVAINGNNTSVTAFAICLDIP